MNAEERRASLLLWLRQNFGETFTATRLVDLTGIYTGHGRYDRCFDDLKVLARRGVVQRLDGRPATWVLS